MLLRISNMILVTNVPFYIIICTIIIIIKITITKYKTLVRKFEGVCNKIKTQSKENEV
jgi:hypothetical protein